MSAPCNCLVSQIHWAVVGWEIEIYCEEVPDETKINIVFFYLCLISSLKHLIFNAFSEGDITTTDNAW